MKKYIFLMLYGITAYLPVTLFADPAEDLRQQALNIVEQLSDEELIAQTLIVGWQGIEASEELLQWLRSYSIGGIKVFGWNGSDVDRLRASIADMQSIAQTQIPGLPLLVATDQEGGLVRHIKDSTTITPGNLAIGASDMAYDAYLTGYYINKELANIGITMNFAPTVDVLVERESNIIGSRAFSSDHQAAALFGTAYMQGSLDAGILPTAKHFPGHGNTTVDSHGKLPVIEDDYETLWRRDFYPYRMMIPSGLPAILIGHLNFPNITNDDTPSTFSSIIIQDILRKQLNFDGLLVTDDLYMGGSYSYAVKNAWSTGELVLEAIRTGNDLIMLSRTPSVNGAIMRTLLDAYRSDASIRGRFQEAARRVVTAKLLQKTLKGLKNTPSPLIDTNPDSESFFFQSALRSVTLIRKTGEQPANTRDTVIVSNDFDFIRAARVKFPNSHIISYRSEDDIRAVKQQIDAYAHSKSSVILSVINNASYDLLNLLQDYKDRLYVIAALNPFRLVNTSWVHNAIAVYGWGFESYLGGLAVLSGEINAHGILPLE